ncbi:MAG: ABC transporter ATP-binding protein [Clostridia bacterium]|nr:ABC transporter ATP-binding protein [Clostridia bacterium]
MYLLNNVKYKGILRIAKLEIKSGKVTCIVGESGSGKSTLLKLLNKMISNDEGNIMFEGIPLDKLNSITLRRNVAMLPQSPAIFPGSIRENLLIGLKFSEKPIVDDNTLNETLEFVSLTKALDEDAEVLSGGEKQRLALGRILLLDPPVFLLDEPSSALDENTEHIIIEKLVEHVKSRNKTMIMVTHSIKIAQKFSDEIIEIRNGEVVSYREVL